MTELALGIGCFHFGFRRPPNEPLTVSGFLRDVEATLARLPNVSDVTVSCDEEITGKTVDTTMVPSNIQEGGPLVPGLTDGLVTFELLVPSDVQEQVAPFPIVRTATERFSVEIHYQYSMPVAVIEPVAPTERPDPSDAVAIIRNLLTREFEKISEANVSFQFVGPSPLHADVYLSPSSIDDVHNGRNFSLQLRRSRGYDEYAFSYQAGAFASPQAAKDALLEEVLPELDVFYELQRMLAARRREWIKVNEVFWDLVELQERSGFKPWLKRAFQGRRLLNSAFLELAFFQGNQVLGMGAFKRSYHDTFSADNPAYFRGLVDETLQHRESYPIEQVERVLDLLERRRLKGVEIVFLGLAALLGSGLGALVTALVS